MKKHAVMPPVVCELVQLELPLEPPKTQDSPTLQTSTSPKQDTEKATQTAPFATDRIGMTAFSFYTYTGLFAEKVIEAYKNGELPTSEAVHDFGIEHARSIFNWNYKYYSTQEKQKNKRSKK